jgi:hypothetical protein
MIGYVSPYTVSDSGAFTTSLFAYYSPIAAALLANEGGADLPATLYDHCHALIICHLFAVKGGETALKSFSSGGLSWSKNPGETPYLIDARAIIARELEEHAEDGMSESAALVDVVRADANIGNLKLDRSTSPVFFGGI